MAEQDKIIIGSICLGILTQGLLAILVIDIFSSYLIYFLVQISNIGLAYLFYLALTKIVEVLEDKGFFERI